MNMIKIVCNEYEKMNGKKNIIKSFLYYYYSNNFRCQCKIRRALLTKNKYIKHLKLQKLERKFGILIGDNAQIGNGFSICHFEGIVIGGKVKIGDNCNIYQQVTIGQKNNKYPLIGDDVTLYPGCKVIGGITIGNNVKIAPNAVVINNIPDNSIAVGIPARIIKNK